MSKSKNPFPKEFDVTYVGYKWNGESELRKFRAKSTNGWYSFYEPGKWYSTMNSMRYRDIERLINSGRLFIGTEMQEDEEIDATDFESVI